MRISTFLFSMALASGGLAQPDFDRNYCGFAPNDSIDITNDGIPDLVVLGSRSGTDDEPSSSGNCTLYVMNLPGTALLSGRYGQGYRHLKVFAKGDTVTPLTYGHAERPPHPRLAFVDGSVLVAQWGYGHQHLFGRAPQPRHAALRIPNNSPGSGLAWVPSSH
ncbi:MAG: hypothetical protein IPP33_06335 [Flavobacteriales bacterium]|nr:hypothetical protein [Flavobacteriales bacterium]